MKVFPLAVTSLLTLSPLPSAAQQGVRGTNTVIDSSASASVSSLDLGVGIQESSCMQIKDEDKCNGSKDEDGIECVWCKCSAIPSECLNVDQSKAVPAGVFDCADPSSPDEKTASASASASATTFSSDGVYNTNLSNYSLRDGTVDGNLCDPNSKSISGYMDVSGSKYDDNEENKHLFYWFFEKRNTSLTGNDKHNKEMKDPKDIPIILWLTGGPGCSSTLALLFENGPCKVNPDGQSTSLNPYSWTESAHVLWLDQPAGVGFSYGKENDYNEEMISEDAYFFLQKFYASHPEYSENPLTVIGESYGGHYAPAVAHKIWTNNQKLENHQMKNKDADALMHINLAGLAVGNGLTDPYVQYAYYPEMARHNSHGIQVLSEDVYNQMTDAIPKCQALITECNAGTSIINRFACQTAFVICNTAETTPYQLTGLNPYDIRKKCEIMPLCYDFSYIEKFLNLQSTRDALHVTDESRQWTSCNMGINLKFHSDWMHDFSPFVADLLDAGIHTLIYAGDVDYICNYLGNRAWTLQLDWKHKNDFNAASDHEWMGPEIVSDEVVGDGKGVGLAKTSHGFTFLQVYDAGHMVPSDQPKVALDMITHFINGGEF
jgi:cathepsin A (carboxypeptidase C)